MLTGRARALWADQTVRMTLLLTANNLVTGLGGLAFWVLAARVYAPAVVGAATAGTAMVVFLAGVGQLGLGTALVRYGGALGAGRRGRLAAIFLTVALAGLLVGWAFVRLAPAVAPGLGAVVAAPLDGALFVASCAAWTVSVQYDNYLLSRRLSGQLIAKSLLIGALRLGWALLLPQAGPALIVAMTGTGGLLALCAVAPLARGARAAPGAGDEPTVTTGRFVRFALWSYLGGLAGTMPALLLPAILVARVGPAPAAAAYMAWTLFGILLFVPSALGLALLSEGGAGASASTGRVVGEPGLAQANSTRCRGLHPSSFILHPCPSEGVARAWVGRAIAVGPLLLLPAALLTLAALGPAYLRDGGPVLLTLGAGYWAYYRVQVLTARLRLTGDQRRLTLATTVSQCAIVAGSVPLLDAVGVAGGALAWSIGQWLLVLLLQAQVTKTLERAEAR